MFDQWEPETSYDWLCTKCNRMWTLKTNKKGFFKGGYIESMKVFL